jgi:DNA-binding transcriptional LysR family regulator
MADGLVNLRNIRHFVVVAEEENLHRAAERLRIAQPALTRQIKLLELDLGAVLFERLPRGLKLTAAGRSYLKDARDVLAMSLAASRRARLVDQGFLGSIKLGFHEVAHRYAVFKAVMARFMADYPNVQFEFHTMSSQDQIDGLIRAELDAGFLYSWNPLPPPLASVRIRKDNYLVVAPPQHPLARRSSTSLAELADEPFIWIDRPRNHAQSDALIAACARVGFTPRIVHDGVGSESSMLSLVSIGAGLAFLPSSLREVNPPVALVPVVDFDVNVELHLVYQSDNSSLALEHFIRCTENVANAMASLEVESPSEHLAPEEAAP